MLQNERVNRLRYAAAAALVTCVIALSACAGEADTAPDAPAEPPATSGNATQSDTSAAPGQTYGCTDDVLAYLADSGYPDATPSDPATFAFPEGIGIAAVPDCYVVDDVAGATRSGAVFTSDPDAALAEIGAALTAAGYVQSDDYGPYIWWIGGDEPTSAAHAVGAAPQDIAGQPAVWATW